MASEKIQKKASPIVKWVGGKRQLISDLLDNMPKTFNRYFEPFIGGGALFFKLQPKQGYIADINFELINLYLVIRNNINELINDLSKHQISREYFLNLRNLDRTSKYIQLSDIQRASRFIYLNKTCFNGLYRVNSKGHFNVPFGKYKNPKIIDKENLYNCSKILQDTEIRNSDFRDILNYIKKGDFVYFDPPYVPLSKTSSFTSYTSKGFDMDMQYKLRDLCSELDKLGVFFMLSNSDSKIINKMYMNYNIKKVFASRSINSNGNDRGKITEVLIKNY